MTQSDPVLTPAHADESVAAYRPVSGLAIAGLLLAGLYAVLVVIATIVAFIQGAPFFLAPALLVVPVAGAVLSWMAQRQIRNSEGTRVGLGLARWGLGLSIVAGLGYTAYQYFTGLAITQQANNFLMKQEADGGFFPRLQTGDPKEINAAFLLTLPESARGNIDPADMRKMAIVFDRSNGPEAGPLTKFRDYSLVRAIVNGRKDTSVQPLGLQSWSFDKGGYQVVRNYRITTPEAIFDVLLPVQSTEVEERKWFLNFPQITVKRTAFSALGVALQAAAASARAFAQQQVFELTQGKGFDAVKDVTHWDTVANRRGAETREHLYKLARSGNEIVLQLAFKNESQSEIMPWTVDPASKRLRFTFKVMLRFRGLGGEPSSGDGEITVEDPKPISVDANGQPVIASLSPNPHWKIVSLEFKRLGGMDKMQ